MSASPKRPLRHVAPVSAQFKPPDAVVSIIVQYIGVDWTVASTGQLHVPLAEWRAGMAEKFIETETPYFVEMMEDYDHPEEAAAVARANAKRKENTP